MALYLFALRNVVFALRSELFRLNELSIYNDHSFLQKLLLYSRKKSAKLLPVRRCFLHQAWFTRA